MGRGMSTGPRTRLYNPLSVAAIFREWIDSRPVEVRGVLMRSTLEANFAHHLDRMGAEWVYEPRIYGPKGAGYLPDFQIVREGPPCFVEVKPTLAEVPLAQERMEVIWDTEPGAVLMVACAEGCTFSAAVKGEPWSSFVELWKHG